MLYKPQNQPSVVIVAEADACLRELLLNASLQPIVAESCHQALEIAGTLTQTLFLIDAAHLRQMSSFFALASIAMLPRPCYVLALCEPGETYSDGDVDDFVTKDQPPQEILRRIKMGYRLIEAQTKASAAQQELQVSKEEMAQYEAYLNDATRQLVEMTAQLQAEMLRNQALEAERIKIAKMDTIYQATATLRHEVNNPLYAITGSAEIALMRLHKMAERGEEGAKTLISCVERILMGAERISQTIVSFSKVVVPTSKDYLPGMPMLNIAENEMAFSEDKELAA